MPVVTYSPTSPLHQRIRRMKEILGMIAPVPVEWLTPSSKRKGKSYQSDLLEPIYCDSYRELVTAWKKAVKWTEGLDAALSVMLASAMSTNFVGEQLWVKIIGPPSCGKTTLLEGLAVSKKYVYSKDTIRGFHTGFKTEDGEDTSLVAMARGKTLATKDGDTLLKQPNLSQILSEARGVYDRVSRTHYRNNVMTDYTGLRMTWILCGTSALREIDDSELGARFIDCVVMDDIDDEFEDDVGWRAANQESRNMLLEADGHASSQYPPELAYAMQLTGGYVEYLRGNAVELSSGIEASEQSLRQCSRLGKFIAMMRARPSKKQDEKDEREFSPRLVKQMVRTARALSVVLNRKEVDTEVMNRVTKVAYDTSRGVVLTMVDKLYRAHNGLETKTLAFHTHMKDDRAEVLVRFLRSIGVVEPVEPPRIPGTKVVLVASRFALTERMRKLYHLVGRGSHV